jgi:4-coumarate--CoA ligase
MDPDGFFKTGDIAKLDLKGNVFITGRVKELIKYKGFQVTPAELEDVLCTHEAVQDCAIVARPADGEAGEVPRAYVVLNEGFEHLTPEDIMAWTAERVAPFKKLRGGVIFIDKIPKSAAGKILRNDLVAIDKKKYPY